jgi:hypothetical protein
MSDGFLAITKIDGDASSHGEPVLWRTVAPYESGASRLPTASQAKTAAECPLAEPLEYLSLNRGKPEEQASEAV